MRKLATALTLAVLPLIAIGVLHALAGSTIARQHIPVCPGIAAPGFANCHAILALPAGVGTRFTGTNPDAGYQPAHDDVRVACTVFHDQDPQWTSHLLPLTSTALQQN